MKRGLLLTSFASPCLAALALSGCIELPSGGITTPEPEPFPPRFASPIFGPAVSQAVAPPPLSGGTLLLTRDGGSAVAADPDRDRIVVVDVARRSVRATLALRAGDEPGRAVEDDAGKVHVVLRGADAIVDVDAAAGTLLGRRSACPAPRGIAFDKAHGELIVACAGGELVRLPPLGGAASRTTVLERDLRDVVVDRDGTVFVTRLRTAEVLVLGGGDQVAERVRAPLQATEGGTFAPNTAWRAVPLSTGGLIMTHQRSAGRPIETTPGAYGSGGNFGCSSGGDGIVRSTLSVVRRDAWGTQPVNVGPTIADVVLPVDLAVDEQGGRVAVVSAGNTYVTGAPRVIVGAFNGVIGISEGCVSGGAVESVPGEPTSVAWTAGGDLVVQTREPAALQFVSNSALGSDGAGVTVPLGGESRFDTGHAVFHSNSGAGLACASCHAEGGDDARTWQFAGLGPRRTQSLRGGISGRAPFHWSGDEADFTHLVTDVFVGRMSGPALEGPQSDALLRWVDRIPRLPTASLSDASAVERGRQLYHDETVACASCHGGDKLTDNRRIGVGTDGTFKTPSLVNIAARAPFLHDGCAPTLYDRFGPCGGGDLHGHTSQLSPAQIKDLVAYLETL